MHERLYSDSWYRVSGLKPRLRTQAKVHRHSYRDRLWYVVENTSNSKFYRLTDGTYALCGLMDGSRTVQEIWNLACERLGDGAPTQDQTVRPLAQLHTADLILYDRLPHTEQLERRRAQESRQERLVHMPSKQENLQKKSIVTDVCLGDISLSF